MSACCRRYIPEALLLSYRGKGAQSGSPSATDPARDSATSLLSSSPPSNAPINTAADTGGGEGEEGSRGDMKRRVFFAGKGNNGGQEGQAARLAMGGSGMAGAGLGKGTESVLQGGEGGAGGAEERPAKRPRLAGWKSAQQLEAERQRAALGLNGPWMDLTSSHFLENRSVSKTQFFIERRGHGLCMGVHGTALWVTALIYCVGQGKGAWEYILYNSVFYLAKAQ